LEKKEFNFKVCQKVVKIMGGNIMIKSTVGMGTEITLTMDQRVYHEKETSVLNQYENAINTSKKVLIVAQDKDLANYIKRKLNNNDISYSSLAFGGDAVDRIKAGKEYDYMLIEDDMKEMSGLATLQELQKLKDFDIPVIVMLNESKDSIKEHYIKDGFDDYLLTNNLEEEVKRIIDKY
jgi:CheY-like chemotaxis protein